MTVVDGVAVGGPGGGIAAALTMGMTEPVLVNGAIFKDSDGKIYLAKSVADPAVPTFGDPILEVENYTGSRGRVGHGERRTARPPGGQRRRLHRKAQMYGVVAP